MQYAGGKKNAKRLVMRAIDMIDPLRQYHVIEPFSGSHTITCALIKSGRTVTASDANQEIVTLYQHAMRGWLPDLGTVTRELHAQYKRAPDPFDPMTAFLAYGCSFGGVRFGTYCGEHIAPLKRRPNTGKVAAVNSLARKISTLKSEPIYRDYRSIPDAELTGAIVYCDPPYRGTEPCGLRGAFDHDAFYAWCIRVASIARAVLISEQSMPEPFRIIAEQECARTMASNPKKARAIERVYTVDV